MKVIFNHICIICSKPFKTISNVKFTCSPDCRHLQRKVVRNLWYKNHSKYVYEKYRVYYLKYKNGRQKAERLINKLGMKKICSQCNSVYKVEIHHIDKNVDNNDLNNLIILCRNCHVKFHLRALA